MGTLLQTSIARFIKPLEYPKNYSKETIVGDTHWPHQCTRTLHPQISRDRIRQTECTASTSDKKYSGNELFSKSEMSNNNNSTNILKSHYFYHLSN